MSSDSESDINLNKLFIKEIELLKDFIVEQSVNRDIILKLTEENSRLLKERIKILENNKKIKNNRKNNRKNSRRNRRNKRNNRRNNTQNEKEFKQIIELIINEDEEYEENINEEKKQHVDISKNEMNNIKVFTPKPVKPNPFEGLFGKILFGVAKNELKEDNEDLEDEDYEDEDYLEDLEKPIEKINIRVKTIEDLIQLGNIYKENNKNKKESQIKTKLFEYDNKYYSINLEILNRLIKPLTKLQSLIGMENVKSKIVKMIVYYIQNLEYTNKNMLHTIIEGGPGVGKTEVAKIIGEIYACMGIVKSNKFKKIKLTDLKGEYVGHTAHKTQKLFDDPDGGIIFIDEAYSLGGQESIDTFSKECIDIINQNLSEKKNKFIVIIAGYADQLKKSFFAYNEGLARRFPFRYTIEKYNAEQLAEILIKKVKDIKWNINVEKYYIINFFKENSKYFNNYGGDIENLLTEIKFSHSFRICGDDIKLRRNINLDDFEDGFKAYKENKIIDDNKDIINSMYN